ncbi:prephenate dehydrogenase [Acetobacter oeni]|nr:prephenate dehydrogenase [Acetobacter oeni]NHO18702.1 prephenate dehydrogenase/arogenate dehydrogenase family protein [Acetobacter oeni]GBR05441.1 prephenate dehydrogenase [Acetobacter oeni LMG 21952]
MTVSDESGVSVGIVGFGVFGQLIAGLVLPYYRVDVCDPDEDQAVVAERLGAGFRSLEDVVSHPVVVLAVPVAAVAEVARRIAPMLKPGTLVLDVGSVKVLPARAMLRELPSDVDIIATHPLFGPQSARRGLAGARIVLCPVRGRHGHLAAFLRRALGLRVIVTTPEGHDREMAVTQGLTHWLARALVGMEASEPALSGRLTTASFDLIREAVGMVRYDAPAVYEAIGALNPYAAEVRRDFLKVASRLDCELDEAFAERPDLVCVG